MGEYTSAGALIEETVWFGDIPVATLRPNGSGINVYYVHTDQLNTPRRVTSPSTNTVIWRWESDPFGATAANQDPDGDAVTFTYNLRFPGQYFDGETGLNYNYFRDYDPAVGRYVESDPIGLAGGANGYAYALGNPMSRADPLGLFSAGAHHEIYRDAFPGLDPRYLSAIESGSDWVDYLYQLNGGAYRHAMRAPGQSVDDAKKAACDYVRANMATFRKLQNATKLPYRIAAYEALGRALHTITDSVSPAHQGWQEWNLWSDQWEWHGDAGPSLESLEALTPELLKRSLNLVRDAMNGNECGCISQ